MKSGAVWRSPASVPVALEADEYEWVDAPQLAEAREKKEGFPLYDALPGLSRTVARVDMIAGETAVARMGKLEAAVGTRAKLFIKRDDKSSPLYGGNKVRKFEFTFADILAKRPSRIITGGGTGSHMTVAAAAFAQRFGIPIETVHFAQPVTKHVQQNVRLNRYFGADMHYAKSQVGWGFELATRWIAAKAHAIAKNENGPFLLLPGDSNALSSLGYVNAAFELREQIRAGAVPEPDYIYVAAGSGGTLAGLIVGLRLAGLKTKVVGVRVAAHLVDNEAVIAHIANETLEFISKRTTAQLADVTVHADDVILLDEYYGDGYGVPTPEGRKAVALAQSTEQIPLETTYTGKAMAAMLAFAKTPQAAGKKLMFWNTYNSVDLTAQAKSVPNSAIPEAFHKLLEADIPLR